jgi:uncharacterized NAD(P)/FAD-binding protein YdhS
MVATTDINLVSNELFEALEVISSPEELQLLISKTSNALDEIETELIEEVSDKSDAFFEAISAMDNLSDQTASLSSASRNLSTIMDQLCCKNQSELQKMEALAKEQEILLEAEGILEKAAEFTRSQSTIQTMLDTHAFSDALRVVNDKISIMEKDLGGLVVFEPILIELREMRVALEKMAHADVIL